MAVSMKQSIRPSGVSLPSRPCLRNVAGRRVCAARPTNAPKLRVAAASSTTAAEARWASQIKEGRVVNVTGQDVSKMVQEGWTLLDCRSPEEANKVPVLGALQIPLFVEDNAMSIGTLAAKWAHFGTGGWWLGGTHMIPNQNFLAEVQAKIPKDARVIVTCQKGLRSLAACEQLSRAGYTGGLAWINGGLDTCRPGDVPTPDNKDIRYAGIGGFSEVLGWTEVQQAENKQQLGGADGVIKIFVVILAADVLLFAYEYITAIINGTTPPSL